MGVPVGLDDTGFVFGGVVVTEIATGTTTTWGGGFPCGATRLRGTFLSYPMNDETGSCRMAIVDLATATPRRSGTGLDELSPRRPRASG